MIEILAEISKYKKPESSIIEKPTFIEEFTPEKYEIVVKEQMETIKLTHLESLREYNEKGGSCVERIDTINSKLKGGEHPETGVPFDSKIVEDSHGNCVEVVVPEFNSVFDVQLPDNMYEATDKNQFEECTRQLKESTQNDPELAKKFTEEQLEQINDGETPDGFTWHHNEEKGKMQLVDQKIHSQTGHTGGRYIWGGGTEKR